MIVSDLFRFVFIHIPKCGGTTVRTALEQFDDRNHYYYLHSRSNHDQLGFLDYQHIPLSILRDHFGADFECVRNYAGFALTRDPFERFPSSLSERMIWKGRDFRNMTSKEISFQVDEVIEYLGGHLLKMPILEPDFIHFSRQIDYIYLNNEKIIENIYPVEALDNMLFHLADLTGRAIRVAERKNERLLYRNKALQIADRMAQRAIVAAIPRSTWKPVFTYIKRGLLSSGILASWSHWHADVFRSDKVQEFISKFYEADIELYKAHTKAQVEHRQT